MAVPDKFIRPAEAERTPPRPVVIELRIAELRQLFHAINPSPFRERDLDQNAESFIVGWARDIPRKARLAMLVYVDRPIAPHDPAEVRDAVHAFFSQRANAARQRLRQLLRIGRTSLIIGITLLGASVGLASLVANTLPRRPIADILRESLVVGGWVAMWRPLEMFLYDWWPIRSEVALFDRLSTIPVRVISTQSGNSKPSIGPVTLK